MLGVYSTSQLNLVEDLPLVPKELLYSYLSVRDLKNLRLVSSRLSCNVLKVDKRFRILTLRSSKSLPDELHSKDITVCLDTDRFQGDASELFDWMKLHSAFITSLRLKLLDEWDQLVSPCLEFPGLKKVKLYILDLSADYVQRLLKKYGPYLEALNIRGVDFQDVQFAGLFCLSSLRVANFSDVDGVSQLLEILDSTTKNFKILDLESYPENNLSPCSSALETVKISGLNLDLLDGQMEHDLPALKNAFLSRCRGRLDSFLGRCPNVECLRLCDVPPVHDKATAHNLKHLLVAGKVSWLPNLLNLCRTRLETLVLEEAGLAVLGSIDGRLTNLKKLCLSSPPSQETWNLLNGTLLPDGVELYYDFRKDFQGTWEKFIETGKWHFDYSCNSVSQCRILELEMEKAFRNLELVLSKKYSKMKRRRTRVHR